VSRLSHWRTDSWSWVQKWRDREGEEGNW